MVCDRVTVVWSQVSECDSVRGCLQVQDQFWSGTESCLSPGPNYIESGTKSEYVCQCVVHECI